MNPLPIDEALPRLLSALADGGAVVLQAPPGAGKTTRVPLAILEAGLVAGRIVMLEPRRLAARAAAEQMARSLAESVGATVGYRIRGESRLSPATRIEVVTEGILTRMIQSDPGLDGIGAVIFDEFHERSLHADLGLALALEARAALRPDLLLIVMSATLDTRQVSEFVGAPVVTSVGRVFPVETRWLDRPLPRDSRVEEAMAGRILQALEECDGGLLAFLPGEAEIRRTATALSGRLPADVGLFPLHGTLPAAGQRAALAPFAAGRKLVLATSIAETSLTIDGIRAVIDSGLARRARFDPGSGMSRLVTGRVSRAEADQRRGRAGRVAPGVCWRLWTRGEEGALPSRPPAEIEVADLAALALELALWGSADLRFLTAPPDAALAEARALLAGLGAIEDGRITAHGRILATLPLHPRLGHMLQVAGRAAAPLAALMGDRDPLRGAGADVGLRLALLGDRGVFSGDGGAGPDRGQIERLRDESRRLAAMAPDRGSRLSPGQMVALAYPDRIALRREGDAARFLLSGGRGAAMDAGDALAGQRLLAVADTDGDPREARIRLAAPLAEAELRAICGGRIAWHEEVAWSRREERVVARRQERLGALVFADHPWPGAPADALLRASLDGLRAIGLPWNAAARSLAARMALVEGLPDATEAGLLAGTALLPWLQGRQTAADLRSLDMVEVLEGLMDRGQRQQLEAVAPAAFVTPLGRRITIDYSSGTPAIALRLQEMFGVTRHPLAAGRPVRVTLLSPAARPLQTTTDLPGFWSCTYADVRKEMRGRYPKHPWPEDPSVAEPTLRAKPRQG